MRCNEYSYRKYSRLLSKTMVFPSVVDCCRAPKYLHTIDVLARDPFTIFASKSETTHSLIIITFSSLYIAEMLTLLLISRFVILGYLRSAASWTQGTFSWIPDQYPTSNRRSYTKPSLRVKITIIFSAIQLPLTL